jgi:ABC-type antimicrobial peptide transport system permease subunit
MLTSYFITALRVLKRNWNYTVINVVGLAFALACCLVLFLAIRHELSYDRHHARANRTYRLITYYKKPQDDSGNAGVALPALVTLRNDFPEIKQQLTMAYGLYGALVKVADQKASPIAWYAMNQWLQDFAYQIDMPWWVFAVVGLLAVMIALLTVSLQSIKAALMNPVKSLRSE